MPSFNGLRGWLKVPKNVYTIWGLNLIVQKRVFLVLFYSRRTACIVGDTAKKITSVGLSYKDVILFSKYFTFSM